MIEDITERKQAEEKLLRQAQILEQVHGGIVTTDLDGLIMSWNSGAEKMLGYSSEEALGKPISLVYPQDQLAILAEEVQPQVRKKGWHESELRFRKKSGEEFPVHITLAVLKDANGVVIGMVWSAIDITERKQTEENLAASEAKLRALFAAMTDAVIVLDTDGRYLEIAPTNPANLFRPPEGLLGNTMHEILPKNTADMILSKIHEALQTGQIVSFEYALQIGDREMWFSATASPQSKNTVVLVAHDFTDRKRAEIALRETSERLTYVLANSPTIIYDLKVDGDQAIPIWISENIESILGFSVEAALQPEWWLGQIYPADRSAAQASLEGLFDDLYQHEYRFVRKDGQVIWLHDEHRLLRDEDNQPREIIGAWTDITEGKRAEQALRDSELRFRTLIEQAPVAVLITRNGIGLFANQKALKTYGLSSIEDLVSRPIMELFAPEFQEESRERTRRRALGLPVPVEFKSMGVRMDGSQFPIQVVVAPVQLSDGSANMAFITDITERKQAEEALRESEERYRVLAEVSSDLIFVIDRDDRIQYVNSFAAQQFGMTQEQMIGQLRSVFFPAEDAAHQRQSLQSVIVSGQPMTYDSLLRFGERQIWVSSSLTALRDESGAITAVMGVSRDITKRKQAEQAIRQHGAELETLYESGLTLGRLLPPKEMAQKLIGLMSSKLYWQHITVRLYHPENESLELLAFNVPETKGTAEYQAIEQRFKTLITNSGDGLAGWAVQHGQTVRVGELANDSRYIETVSGLHSGLYVPLKVNERVVGVISIESEKPEAFSEADEQLTITLANQAAIALENARLHEETLHQLKQLQALHTIDRTIAGSLDQSMMLDVLLTQTLSQLEAEAAAIFLIQPHQRGALQYFGGQGFHTHLVEIASMKLGNSIAGEAVVKREMIHVREPEKRESDPLLSKLWLEEGFKGMEAVPLISKGEVKGVMTVFHRKDFTPEPGWSSFLETLAGQAAIAIDVTQMFDNLQRANMELAVAYEATIEGWSQAMDLRDKETEGHSQRVTEMTVQIARAMHLSDQEINHMRRGAQLHDIGKLGVPDHILLKVEKLTDEEWLIMKKHPVFAYDMLHSISYLRDSLDIPYSHHEKWDGTGYPQGLKAEQIPLAARIFAVIDVWDALISDRPYRPAWSKPDAMKYIREQSGKHFDPRVVDVFLKEFGNEST